MARIANPRQHIEGTELLLSSSGILRKMRLLPISQPSKIYSEKASMARIANPRQLSTDYIPITIGTALTEKAAKPLSARIPLARSNP
jgi:hypothetical protein